MQKIAIIGASHFQNPLILKAKEMGIETHVFAWEAGDVGEKTADCFYPISIMDKEVILEKCKEIGIDGIASIGSDLANITVAYVAAEMGLVSNSVQCVAQSTDKHKMRNAFEKGGDPSPRSRLVEGDEKTALDGLSFPLIVKPMDRSGSRGICKIETAAELHSAVTAAKSESFSGGVLVEEYIDGREFSVEYLSWKGSHSFLAITEKFTTGAPGFVEKGHLQPARLSKKESDAILNVVEHALDTLGIEFGASHSEVKLAPDGAVYIIEIGSRMGGDCIGSDLVPLSMGYDFTKAVVDISLGKCPDAIIKKHHSAAIRFVFNEQDIAVLKAIEDNAPELLQYRSPIDDTFGEVTDSSSRHGYYILGSDSLEDLIPYLPLCVEG